MDRPASGAVIAARLAKLEVSPWSGEVWRHTFADNPPQRRNVRGARRNPPGIEALYASLDRATAIAEADYLIAAHPLRPRARRTLHRLRITLGSVVDLTGSTELASLGVDDAALTSDDHRVCQTVGAAAASIGLAGIIVPSARSSGSNIVILFATPDAVPDIEVIESRSV